VFAKPNYMTVPAALKELEKVEMIRQMDGIIRLDHAVTARQQQLLKVFGFDANHVKEKAIDVGGGSREKETGRNNRG